MTPARCPPWPPVPISFPVLPRVVESRACSDGGAILDSSPQGVDRQDDGQDVARMEECKKTGQGGVTEGRRQQFVTQFDGLPFRQASERKQCGAKGRPEVP